MKRIRVKKLLPFAEVGEILEIRLDKEAKGSGNIYQINNVCVSFPAEEWIEKGWLEEIEEEKSLEEKFRSVLAPIMKGDRCLDSFDINKLIEIAHIHEKKLHIEVIKKAEKISSYRDSIIVEEYTQYIIAAIEQA